MLSKSEIKQWSEKGYIVKKGLFDVQLIDKCTKFMNNRHPDSGFGSNGELEFPSNTPLDQITIDENLIRCVQQLLNNNDILLTQCDSWSKGYSNEINPQKNTDQRMHMDYGNNTFLHPSDWNNPEAVSAIVYLSDTSITGGQTSVVEKTERNTQSPYIMMPGQVQYSFYNDKTSAEQYFKKNHKKVYEFRKNLYHNEILIPAQQGDILFYRLDIWHRGTPVKKNMIRHVMNLGWKKKECYWINQWNKGWTQKMYYGWLEKMFVNMSPKQRSILGVAMPGDKYWTKKSLANLKARYKDIDLIPYLSKL